MVAPIIILLTSHVGLSFFVVKDLGDIPIGSPPKGAPNACRVMRFPIFDQQLIVSCKWYKKERANGDTADDRDPITTPNNPIRKFRIVLPISGTVRDARVFTFNK